MVGKSLEQDLEGNDALCFQSREAEIAECWKTLASSFFSQLIMPTHEMEHTKLRVVMGKVHLVQTFPQTCIQRPGSIENLDAAVFRISITYSSTCQSDIENIWIKKMQTYSFRDFKSVKWNWSFVFHLKFEFLNSNVNINYIN